MPTTALRVPVQSRSQKTRAALLAAASKEFSEQGYAVATAKSIAERARVGTGTFYHYFPDKDAALREISAERVEYLLGESALIAATLPKAGTARDLVAGACVRLEKLVRLYLDYHRVDRGIHGVLTERRFSDPALDAIMAASEQEAVRRFTVVLALWQREGNREAVALMMFSLLEGAVHGHVFSEPVVSDERFVAGLVEGMLRLGLPSKHLEMAARLRRKESP